MKPINRVAIVGGTHGNEFTGIYLIKKFEQFPNLIHRTSFETLTLIGNPKAFAAGTRYIEKDLNRCFLIQDLQNETLLSYEEIRAKQIHRILGPKGKSKIDLIVDLHTTTSNMGLSVILSSNHPFNLQLAGYLTTIDPLVKVYSWTQPGEDAPFLKSLCDFGFTIEVGPISQGILDAELFQKAEKIIYALLDYLEAYNQGTTTENETNFAFYQYIDKIDYPRNENGEIQAMIHPQLQFRDYQALHPGEPIFLTFDGQTIAYEGESIVYPVFINEAAYYEKGIAMCLTQKQQITF